MATVSQRRSVLGPTSSGVGHTRIIYPSYRSLDEFLDIQRLRTLNSYIARRIRRHIAAEKDSFFLNEHRLEKNSPYVSGVREIWLSRTKPGTPYNYLDLDKTDLWEPTEAAGEFTMLMEFIRTLPFKSTGRILIIYDDGGNAVPAHRDHERTDVCHDFVWMRTNLSKPFYLLNRETGEKQYVGSYTAWFDTVNQFHGSDAAEGLTFSIRVDGHFTDEFRSQVPRSPENPAAAPALWAAASA